MPGETVFYQKFHSNTIKFVLDEKVAVSRDEATRPMLLEQLCSALNCTNKKLARLLSNSDQPTVPQLVSIAQVLGVTVDYLIKLEDAPAVHTI